MDTIFSVLVIICKVSSMYIKVDGFMVRRLTSEAELVNTLLLKPQTQTYLETLETKLQGK